MIIVVFLLVIVLGLGAFFFILMKEMKGVPQTSAPSLSKNDTSPHLGAGALNFNAAVMGGPIVPSLKNGHQDVQDAFVDKLDQKCLKLEQMLDEKNRTLAKLQEDIQHERSHRKEFENFKDILQCQIEELKMQNKKLREDLARAVQGNNFQAQAKTGGGTPVVQEREVDAL